jgi:hypothetical protein
MSAKRRSIRLESASAKIAGQSFGKTKRLGVRSYATTCGVPPDRPPQIPVPGSVKECFKQAAQARVAFIRAYGPENAETSSSGQALATAPAMQSLKLSGNQRWVVLASRRDVDEAIGIARYYSAAFPSVRVIKTNSGIYAVMVGPEHTTSIQAFRERVKSIQPIPEDAFFVARR